MAGLGGEQDKLYNTNLSKMEHEILAASKKAAETGEAIEPVPFLNNLPPEKDEEEDNSDTIEVQVGNKMVRVSANAIKKGLTQADETYAWVVSKLMRHFDQTPYLTRGQIQMALGPAMPPRIWGEPLRRLVIEGKLCMQEVQAAYRIKIVYHKPEYPWPPLSIKDIEDVKAASYTQGREAAFSEHEALTAVPSVD